jgi:isopentenyldiphosphate isomerase
VTQSPADPAVELLDLVDLDDRVIGVVEKPATDVDPSLVHREIVVLIHRGDMLLWQLRSAAKTVMPLIWDVSVAGHVGAGEAPDAAARRELREELGISLELVALERRLVRLATETCFSYVYAAAAGPAFAPVPDPGEVAALEWCDAAGFARWRAQGRPISPVGIALGEAFWGGVWEV